MSSQPPLSSASRSHSAMTPTTANAAAAVAADTAMETLVLKLTEICSHAAEDYPWDPPRRFTVLAQRLQLLVAQLSHPGVLPSSPAVSTALRGIAGNVSAAVSTLSSYRSRSRIYVLIHCLPLCSSLRSLCSSLASSLALLDTPLSSQPDLQKRASDLARDFLLSDLRVPETEERVYSALQREGEARESGKKAVQSGIIMDLARALGSGPEVLADQIKLLRSDFTGPSTSPAERRILVSLEKIFGSWSATEPCVSDRSIDVDFDENATIPPFKNFLCPLTKVVMKDPVVLESLQTYERAEIKHWFDWCLEDGRDPTCPVTGQVLKSLELKPNIGLAGAIEEWVNRNIEVQIKSAVQYLGGEESSSSLECVERALDNVYRISEEHPTSRYRARNAGIIGLVVKMLKEQSKVLGSELRTKALMVMDSMAKDHESKLMMLGEGLSRLAIRSLNGSSEKEREYALSLLLQFSDDRSYCAKMASEKGALVLLSSLAENLEHPKLSNMAEGVLKNMEKEEDNVQHLAVVGRFQPLLNRLCEGSEDVRINMANIVGKMKLTNNAKEHVARQGGRALIAMLSSRPEGRASSLQALYNLSTLDDNSTILVDFGLLPALNNILFMTRIDDPPDLKDLAASTISNIVSNTGHWELSFADDQGHLMQSESVIHSLLQLLTNSSSKCQTAILKILCGIASSPQASELATAHIGSGNGIATILPFLEQPETEQRINAFRLANLLSRNLGLALAHELRSSNKLILLKEKLMDPQCLSGEKSEITCILANLPITDDEVKMIFGAELLRWVVDTLKRHLSSSLSNKSKHAGNIMEGLIGLLVHYARSSDQSIWSLIQESQFMTIFIDTLNIHSQWRAKQRAVLGLKYLSQSANAQVATGDLEPRPPRGFCAPLVLICGKAPMPSLCPIHNASCEENSSFCLLKGNAIRPLVELLNDKNTDVQIAAVEALFTLVLDPQSLTNSREVLEQLDLFDTAVTLFKKSRPGELQERIISMVDRFLRVESLIQCYSLDQDLVRALVEALKHGTTNTKRLAQDILTNLRELSGVGGKTSNHSRGRRTNR